MKTILFPTYIAIALVAWECRAADHTELERAIRELPAQFVADIPLSKRSLLLKSLRRDPSDTRLDLQNGYLHFYSDSSHDGIKVTSQLYLRQLPRAGGGFVVLTHMPKPFADGALPPRANQTFVFERRNGEWTDITAEVLPGDLDLTSHFRPRRAATVIEVAPYLRIKRLDHRGDAWKFGEPTAELHWDGHVFQKRTPTKKTLSND